MAMEYKPGYKIICTIASNSKRRLELTGVVISSQIIRNNLEVLHVMWDEDVFCGAEERFVETSEVRLDKIRMVKELFKDD